MIRFDLSIPDPHTHLVHVRMHLDVRSDAPVILRMPVWAPGSYLVREYPRHIQQMRAHTAQGAPLEIAQADKASWRLDPRGASDVVVEYEVFSHELAVRTNHIDDTHASLNGVATFLYLEERRDDPVEVVFTKEELPDGWRPYSGLHALDDHGLRWRADDVDMLYDSPFEIGDFDPLDFEVGGIPHRILLWGEARVDTERLVSDVAACVEANASLFGGFPYTSYLFIVHLTEKGRGGLEHHNSTILLYPRDGFRDGPPGSEVDDEGYPKGGYLGFLRLVAHEHFHVWNVKRIRPAVLGPFDYQGENYTRDLWTVEGITSYYENIALVRAGLMTPETFLKINADAMKALTDVPGRRVHSLEDASFNAWVKLYRPDENSLNSSVSYYLKGEVVTFLLDAYIRANSGGASSLDDVLEMLWSHFEESGQGYEEGSYGAWVERATGVDIEAFLERRVRGSDTLHLDEILSNVGLTVSRTHTAKKERGGAWIGAQTKSVGQRAQIWRTPTGGPAQRAGLYSGDDVVAIDHRRVTAKNFKKLIAHYEPGDRITVHLFRRGMLIAREVELGEAPHDTWSIEVSEEATSRHAELLSSWIGLEVQG